MSITPRYSIRQIEDWARAILSMPKSARRDQLVDIARTAQQREKAIEDAGEVALLMAFEQERAISHEFAYSWQVGMAASWLVYLRKNYGDEIFEEVVKCR